VFGGLLDTRQLTNLISQGRQLLGRATMWRVGDHDEPVPARSEPPQSTQARLDAARDRLKASIAPPANDDQPGI
jgi:hypothetical protein